jgi:glycerol kinase
MILSLDQGTSSSRAILWGPQGEVLGRGQVELPLSTPQPGWVEADPEVILATQISAARQALRGHDPRVVQAVGITNQRETTVVWDGFSGRPLGPALIWQDRRTAARCQQIKDQGRESWLRSKTGLLADPYFSATKAEVLLGKLDPRERETARLGTVDSWLISCLTKGRVHATDATNASRTLLMNLRAGSWDLDLMEFFGIPSPCLPAILPSLGFFGEIDSEWFGAPMPIFGAAGDQQAALYGQNCRTAGQAKNTYGTGCFLLMHTGGESPESRHGLLTTAAAGGAFALEGAVFIAGAAVQWLRDGLGIIASAAEVEPLAHSVPDSGGVVFVPTFTGIGTPKWDPLAQGVIFGLTRGSSKAHLARAALEAVAHQCCDVIEAMNADSGSPLQELWVDGGGSANDLLMQIQADLAAIPVLRPSQAEATSWGAAKLAASGAGLPFPDLPAGQVVRRFEPKAAPQGRDRWKGLLDAASHAARV